MRWAQTIYTNRQDLISNEQEWLCVLEDEFIAWMQISLLTIYLFWYLLHPPFAEVKS